MDEIDAQGRQFLIDRPPLTKGRLSVFREIENGNQGSDLWFPRLSITIRRAGSDESCCWRWTTHSLPIDPEEPPPYGEDVLLEKPFELEEPIKSPRGLETVFLLEPGATRRGQVKKFSAALYLFAESLEDRGVQIGVIDFTEGLKSTDVPLYFRVNFPW
jgi:hypothetical protein